MKRSSSITRKAGAVGEELVGRQLLTIGRYHRNPRDAEEFVLQLFRQHHPTLTLKRARSSALTVNRGGKPFRLEFAEAVKMARETGTVAALRHLNLSDPYFPVTLGMAGTGGGLTVTITNMLGEKVSTRGPMRNMAVEEEFADDILGHRRGACERSTFEDEYRSCTMHLRGYILACNALIEAFLSRPISVELRLQSEPSEGLLRLEKRSGNFEERLELWVQEFCGSPLLVLKQGAEWSALKELRQARNNLMHPPDTQLGVEIKDMARQLNLVRRGVGGFINLLRSKQGLPPWTIAERLETAPLVVFKE